MQKTCRQSVIVDSSPVLPIDQTFSSAFTEGFFFFIQDLLSKWSGSFSFKGGGSRKANSTGRILGLHILGFLLFSTKWNNVIYNLTKHFYPNTFLPPSLNFPLKLLMGYLIFRSFTTAIVV